MSPLTTNEGVEYLTRKEFARRINMTEEWVKDHCRTRESDPIPRVRFGKHVRFAWGSEEMKRWLERRKV